LSESLLRSFPKEKQDRLRELALEIRYRWTLKAREKQLPPPGDWTIWLILTGRGWGKTRTGAEWTRDQVEKGVKRIALIGRTASDVRDVMVEGETGILSVCPPWNRPHYEPTKRRITWPNGAVATTFTGDKPDQLRGPQHEKAWADELAAWRYPEAWDMLMLGMRVGLNPQVIATTTPRPTKHIRDLVARDGQDVVVTKGSTFENIHNLAGPFKDQILRQYEGTRLGRQELYAELLEDTPGALWRRFHIEDGRVKTAPELSRVVIGVDPAVTSSDEANQTGIVVCGKLGDEGYVVDDRTLTGTPEQWATAVVNAYVNHKANLIVAEDNNGGEMVEYTVRTTAKNMGVGVSIKRIRASRGKYTRAEPIAALYEQGKIHHVGTYPELEDQQCTWVPGDDSPDRMDACVWGFTELMLQGEPSFAWA